MKSLNECISFTFRTSAKELKPTRFYEFYPLSERKALLLHLLTGAVDIVDKEEAELIEKAFTVQNLDKLSSSLCAILEKRGYLSNPEDEQVFIDALAERHQEQVAQKPLEFFICTTFSCPVGCTYCFEGDLIRRQEKVDVITEKQINSVFSSINSIKTMQSRSVKEIVLFWR